jgi:PAS domain S-box-containing protein
MPKTSSRSHPSRLRRRPEEGRAPAPDFPWATSGGANAVPCTILHLEDDRLDAELIERTLAAHGMACRFQQVRTRPEYEAALQRKDFDLILADISLPSFDGWTALELARQACPEIPFIFLSGSKSHASTAQSMQRGAADYVSKKDLTSLGPSIGRVLQVMRERGRRRDAEEERDRFFSLSGDLLCVLGWDETFQRVNPSLERALGFARADLEGRPLLDLVHPDDVASTSACLSQVQSAQAPRHFENRLRRSDGSYVWLQWTATSHPERRVLYASARDVTERKMAEAEIQKLAAFPRLNPQAILEFSSTGTLTYFNDAALELARQSGAADPTALLPRDAANLVRHCLATQQSRLHCESELPGRTLSWSFYPIAPSQVVHAYGTDVTERRRSEERLREQAALLDKAQDAIVVRDLEHRILYWNQGAERLFGWTASEAAGRNSLELLSLEKGERFLEGLRCVLEHGEWSGELRHTTKSGTTVEVQTRWTLVRDAQGHPKSVLAFSTDITEKKQLEAQFLRAQRLESIGSLASGIAHDLNNILAPILMSVNLLQETLRDSPHERLLETLRTSVQRGADMVRQILSFTRGQATARATLQLRHLVSETARIASETFPRNIRIQTNVPKDLWPVLADTTQIHQVLMNLCVNARDAMPTGGTLTMAAENLILDSNTAPEAGRAHVVLTIADTGTGMDPDTLARIWDPFFTTKPPGQGTGLGLPTVLNIVRSHGGFIRTQSKPGQGTTFQVFLPAAEAGPPSPLPEPAAPIPVGRGEQILLIDDERAFQEITKLIFQKHGYRVLTANDGAEALAVFAQHRKEIDLVVTDMVMPFLDGPATIRALRSVEPGVLILATSGLSESEKPAGELAHTAFLLKPFTTEQLLGMVDQLLHSDARRAP